MKLIIERKDDGSIRILNEESGFYIYSEECSDRIEGGWEVWENHRTMMGSELHAVFTNRPNLEMMVALAKVILMTRE